MDFSEMEKEGVWVLYRTLSPSLTPDLLLLEGSLNPYSWQKQDQNWQKLLRRRRRFADYLLSNPCRIVALGWRWGCCPWHFQALRPPQLDSVRNGISDITKASSAVEENFT
jgi:hypothetical protein